MTPAQLADRYFEFILARDIENLVGLYAPDAQFIKPDGQVFSGRADIREAHLASFANAGARPSPGDKFLGEDSVAVEIQSRLADGSTARTVNVFNLDSEGRIRRLSVYRQAV